MPKLLFFSRVAFLCNVCFLATFLLRYAPELKNGMIVSTVVVLGLVVAIVLNTVVNLLYFLVIMANKPIRTFVPLWLVIINFLFLVFQAILLFK
ncbi:MAG: hypothetical protein JNK79_18980 [Chitinophagaceae bacterium]|nr:hypothetical protein [Chitinophagaceae bacterium]